MTGTAHKPFVLFVTGVSASGKTTLYESLRADKTLGQLTFHDIDENGVPPVGRSSWRKFRVEELLCESVLALGQGQSTVVCGIVKPHEVVESRYFKPGYNVHFLLVNVPYALAETRIKGRVAAQPKAGAFDADFNPDALQELLLATKELQRELKNTISQQKNGHTLNASNFSKQEMHDETARIIQGICREA